MPVPTAASRLTKTFSWKAAITEFTKFASKEAIPRLTPFVFREWALALADAVRFRRVSWDQSGDGMVVCFWIVSSFSVAAPELGGHASRFWRFDPLVLHHGIGTRRGFNANSVIS